MSKIRNFLIIQFILLKFLNYEKVTPSIDTSLVHDELVFDVDNSELEKIQPMIKHEMENAFKLDVPLEVDLGAGRDWLEAH